MIEYKEDTTHAIAEIVINGKVTNEDFERVAPKLKAFIAAHGKVKLLEEIHSLGGFELAAIAKGIKFDREHLKDFTHCAVISKKGWIGPFSRVIRSFIECEIRVFRPEEIDEARSWLTSV